MRQTTAALGCGCIVLVLFATQRYQQLSVAAVRTHERLTSVQAALEREQALLQAERNERLREREHCAAALPSREAVREALRQLLAEAAIAAAASEPATDSGRLSVVLGNGAAASPTILAQANATP